VIGAELFRRWRRDGDGSALMALRIASAEHGGTFWTQAQALAAVLSRDPALAPVAVLDTPGASVETAELLGSGAAELGFHGGETGFPAPSAARARFDEGAGAFASSRR